MLSDTGGVVVLSKETRDSLDFHLANIEACLKKATNCAKPNAVLSVRAIRVVLDVFHIPGEAGACTAEEYADVGRRHNLYLQQLGLAE